MARIVSGGATRGDQRIGTCYPHGARYVDPASGTPYEVYADPGYAAVARLLGQTNLLPARITRGIALTALGELPVPDAPDGGAEVLVPPESLRALPDPAGQARITDVEFYGHDQLLRCALGEGPELDVRLMGSHPELEVGTAVRLEVIGAARVLRRERDMAPELHAAASEP